MKLFFITVLLWSLPYSSFAGSHGQFKLSCTSKSLRTHLYMQLNDYDFEKEALYPQVIVFSTMGAMDIFNENQDYGFSFKTTNNAGLLEIYSTDKEKTYVFNVDFRKESSANVVIKKGINPRTQKAFSNLVLDCKKRHDL